MSLWVGNLILRVFISPPQREGGFPHSLWGRKWKTLGMRLVCEVFSFFLTLGGNNHTSKTKWIWEILEWISRMYFTPTIFKSALNLLKAIFTYCSIVGSQHRGRDTNKFTLFSLLLTFPHPSPKRQVNARNNANYATIPLWLQIAST